LFYILFSRLLIRISYALYLCKLAVGYFFLCKKYPSTKLLFYQIYIEKYAKINFASHESITDSLKCTFLLLFTHSLMYIKQLFKHICACNHPTRTLYQTLHWLCYIFKECFKPPLLHSGPFYQGSWSDSVSFSGISILPWFKRVFDNILKPSQYPPRDNATCLFKPHYPWSI